MASAEVSHRDGAPQEEEQVPGRRAVHRPVEGLTMQELLRTAAKTTGNSAWAETLQPLATFENSIASRISSQTMENREGILLSISISVVSYSRLQRAKLIGSHISSIAAHISSEQFVRMWFMSFAISL